MTVNGWGLRCPDGQNMVMINNLAWSTPLPHRLEPAADGKWHILTEDVRTQCEARGIRYQDLVAYVNLADGRTVGAGKRGINWKEAEPAGRGHGYLSRPETCANPAR